MARSRFAVPMLLMAALSLLADVRNTASAGVFFVGSNGDWFNPANWSSGQVPDMNTDVVLDGGVQVVIDPAAGLPNVVLHDLIITGNASLTTLDGTVLSYNQLQINDGGLLDVHSTELAGDTLSMEALPRFPLGGFLLNPSTSDSRIIKITASTGNLSIGLGGTSAASPGHTGAGYYATLYGDEIELGAPLQLDLLYGFTPSAGDVFNIIQARQSLMGTFADLPEGSLVDRFGDVGLYISYEAGDGNDVSLIAALVPEPVTALLLLIPVAFLRRQRC